MINDKNLAVSVNLSEETLFHQYISLDKDKLDIYDRAVADGKIVGFDQTTLSRLRKLYFGFFPGLIYMYYQPTTAINIGNRVELLTHTMEDKEYQIVHGNTDSTRNIPFSKCGIERLTFNSWIEVKEGQKIWVYDLFSLLKIEKETYYKLEHPEIKQIVLKSTIMNLPGDEINEFDNEFGNDLNFMIVDMIPYMEKNMAHHPFSNILIPEITRFKHKIDLEKVKLDFLIEVEEIDGFKKRNR